MRRRVDIGVVEDSDEEADDGGGTDLSPHRGQHGNTSSIKSKATLAHPSSPLRDCNGRSTRMSVLRSHQRPFTSSSQAKLHQQQQHQENNEHTQKQQYQQHQQQEQHHQQEREQKQELRRNENGHEQRTTDVAVLSDNLDGDSNNTHHTDDGDDNNSTRNNGNNNGGSCLSSTAPVLNKRTDGDGILASNVHHHTESSTNGSGAMWSEPLPSSADISDTFGLAVPLIDHACSLSASHRVRCSGLSHTSHSFFRATHHQYVVNGHAIVDVPQWLLLDAFGVDGTTTTAAVTTTTPAKAMTTIAPAVANTSRIGTESVVLSIHSLWKKKEGGGVDEAMAARNLEPSSTPTIATNMTALSLPKGCVEGTVLLFPEQTPGGKRPFHGPAQLISTSLRVLLPVAALTQPVTVEPLYVFAQRLAVFSPSTFYTDDTRYFLQASKDSIEEDSTEESRQQPREQDQQRQQQQQQQQQQQEYRPRRWICKASRRPQSRSVQTPKYSLEPLHRGRQHDSKDDVVQDETPREDRDGAAFDAFASGHGGLLPHARGCLCTSVPCVSEQTRTHLQIQSQLRRQHQPDQQQSIDSAPIDDGVSSNGDDTMVVDGSDNDCADDGVDDDDDRQQNDDSLSQRLRRRHSSAPSAQDASKSITLSPSDMRRRSPSPSTPSQRRLTRGGRDQRLTTRSGRRSTTISPRPTPTTPTSSRRSSLKRVARKAVVVDDSDDGGDDGRDDGDDDEHDNVVRNVTPSRRRLRSRRRLAKTSPAGMVPLSSTYGDDDDDEDRDYCADGDGRGSSGELPLSPVTPSRPRSRRISESTVKRHERIQSKIRLLKDGPSPLHKPAPSLPTRASTNDDDDEGNEFDDNDSWVDQARAGRRDVAGCKLRRRRKRSAVVLDDDLLLGFGIPVPLSPVKPSRQCRVEFMNGITSRDSGTGGGGSGVRDGGGGGEGVRDGGGGGESGDGDDAWLLESLSQVLAKTHAADAAADNDDDDDDVSPEMITRQTSEEPSQPLHRLRHGRRRRKTELRQDSKNVDLGGGGSDDGNYEFRSGDDDSDCDDEALSATPSRTSGTRKRKRATPSRTTPRRTALRPVTSQRGGDKYDYDDDFLNDGSDGSEEEPSQNWEDWRADRLEREVSQKQKKKKKRSRHRISLNRQTLNGRDEDDEDVVASDGLALDHNGHDVGDNVAGQDEGEDSDVDEGDDDSGGDEGDVEDPHGDHRPSPHLVNPYVLRKEPKVAYRLFLQFHVSAAVDEDFAELLQTDGPADGEFGPSCRQVEQEINSRKELLIQSSAWDHDFHSDLLAYPTYSSWYKPPDILEHDCMACRRRNHAASWVVHLMGVPYKSQELWNNPYECHIEDIELSSSESSGNDAPGGGGVVYKLGKVCHARTELFHKLHHYKRHVIEAVERKIDRTVKAIERESVDGGGDGADDIDGKEVVLRMLDDEQWVDHMYMMYKALKEEAEGFGMKESY